MSIQYIEIQSFRNLARVELNLNPSFNVLYGSNGSGKTSFLEAIFFLSRGKSFRVRSLDYLIQQGKEHFSIFCKLLSKEELKPIGTHRGRNGEKRIRIEEKEENSYLEVTKRLPVLLINTDEHQLIYGSPEYRRHFLNWGMFHVEPNFHSCWQRLQQALKQRNSILKNPACQREEVESWDYELVSGSNILDELRREYLEALTPIFNYFVNLLLQDVSGVTLSYYRGWNEKEGLEKILQRSFLRDQQVGYTQYGPHRADLVLKVGKQLAKEVLSRGQQKLMVYALRLSQGLLLRERTGQTCIYLIDDFIAELDKQKRALVSHALKDLGAQVFVTGVEKDELLEVMDDSSILMFHVEQGCIVLDSLLERQVEALGVHAKRKS